MDDKTMEFLNLLDKLADTWDNPISLNLDKAKFGENAPKFYLEERARGFWQIFMEHPTNSAMGHSVTGEMEIGEISDAFKTIASTYDALCCYGYIYGTELKEKE